MENKSVTFNQAAVRLVHGTANWFCGIEVARMLAATVPFLSSGKIV
jgi:prophage antirepressor-like protein